MNYSLLYKEKENIQIYTKIKQELIRNNKDHNLLLYPKLIEQAGRIT